MKNVRATIKTSIKNEDINFYTATRATEEQIKDMKEAYKYLTDIFDKYYYDNAEEYDIKRITKALDDAIYYIEDNITPIWKANKQESFKRHMVRKSKKFESTNEIDSFADLSNLLDKFNVGIINDKDVTLKDGRKAIRVTLDKVIDDKLKNELSKYKNIVNPDRHAYMTDAPEIRYSYLYLVIPEEIEESHTRKVRKENKNTTINNRLTLNEKYYIGYGDSKGKYYGVDGVDFIYKGEWADPLIAYNGYIINATAIEDTLYDEFVEYTGDEYTGEVDDNYFDSWVGENPDILIDILNDYIEGYNFSNSFTVDYLIKTNQKAMLQELADDIAYDIDGKRKVFGNVDIEAIKDYYGNKKFTLDDFYTLPYLK